MFARNRIAGECCRILTQWHDLFGWSIMRAVPGVLQKVSLSDKQIHLLGPVSLGHRLQR